MRKTLVCLDCDGPLAEFVNGFLDLIEEETGERFGPAVVTEWEIAESPFFLKLAKELDRDPVQLADAIWKRANRIGFCSSLQPVEGAQDAVDNLRRLRDVEVEVVTSPLLSSPTWMAERHEWLRRHFGFKKDQVHLVAKKHRVPGDFLVDDKPSHVGSWSDRSKDAGFAGNGLLWSAPYNADSEDVGIRVASWSDVYGIVSRAEQLREKTG